MAVSVRKGPGDEVEAKMYLGAGRTPADDTADVRDILTALIGRGNVNMADDAVKGEFDRLKTLVGQDAARKLLTHAFIYNQNPATRKLPIEARIKQFYDAPAGDETVQSALKQVKSFGYGVLPGFRDSAYQVNQTLSGRIPADGLVKNSRTEQVKKQIADTMQ